MINIQIEGNWPSLGKPSSAMRKIAEHLWTSLGLNFLLGGRPQAWLPTKSGETPLVASGRLMNSRKMDYGESFAEVRIGEGVPYAKIHHFGGIIQHPGSQKLQAFTIEGQRIVTRFTRPHQIRIDARPYVLLQGTDIIFAKKEVLHAIIKLPGIRANQPGGETIQF